MKKIGVLFFSVFLLVFSGCDINPLTGNMSMALITNEQLFEMASAEYEKFKSENKVITGTEQALMVERVGQKTRAAAEKWFASLKPPQPDYFKDYQWEFTLVEEKTVNAWAMPGGKIMFYTGILDFMENNEDELAVVMGHEIAHAMLNHTQQRMSEAILQQYGIVIVSQILGGSSLVELGLTLASNVFIALPNSRENEYEADKYGLYLMTIAGYKPEAAGPFWDRMAKMGKSWEFFSTHPDSDKRAAKLKNMVTEAKTVANDVGIIK
uniref:Zn-dependent protease n=1 Tax=uncultured bacterium contig00051 TaxID=1181535 RepID=A0A806K2B5_9BACT|nr:Zn-dependent protease [uncultured bacterium contig00051]